MTMTSSFIHPRIEDIKQALREDNLDYFHQACLNQFYLDFAFSRACHFGTSERIIEHLISLVQSQSRFNPYYSSQSGKPQEKCRLYQACHDAISGKHYHIVHILFRHCPDINIFDKSQLNTTINTDFTYQYVLNLVLDEDDSNHNEGLLILKKIIDNLPHEHTIIFKQDKYRNAYDSQSYRFVYNKLLTDFLWSIIQPFSRQLRASQDNLHLAISMLAQKSFAISIGNKKLIEKAQLEHVFPYHFKDKENTKNKIQYRDNNNKPAKGLASRTLLCALQKEDDFFAKQKLAVYASLAQHFHMPESLYLLIYDAFMNPNNNNNNGNKGASKRRLPSKQEYQFLTQFENSTQNHKKILTFFNQFLYYDKMHLYERLNQTLRLDDLALSHQDSSSKI
jgi:hypothetical protein